MIFQFVLIDQLCLEITIKFSGQIQDCIHEHVIQIDIETFEIHVPARIV